MSENKVKAAGEKIETGVVDGYKKIETGVVEGFEKITDKFVGAFLTQEGESVEEAKARLDKEQKDRMASMQEDLENRRRESQERIAKSIEKSMNMGK